MERAVWIDIRGTGKNITRMMYEKGISAKQVQAQLHFNTPQAVYKWMRGDSLPSVDNLVILADILECTVDEILCVRRSEKKIEL